MLLWGTAVEIGRRGERITVACKIKTADAAGIAVECAGSWRDVGKNIRHIGDGCYKNIKSESCVELLGGAC